MKRKDFKSYGCKPDLVQAFEDYTRKVYGVYFVVPIKYYPEFVVISGYLREADISPRDYADTVLTSMKSWVRDNKMRTLPINTFLSEHCAKKYMRIRVKATVSITIHGEDDNTVLYDELTVLRYYIHMRKSNPKITLDTCISDMQPLLSPQWITAAKAGDRPTTQAIMELADEYGAKVVSLNSVLEAANAR